MRDWIDSLEARLGADRRRRERFLNRVLTLDDDVAEALYSPTRIGAARTPGRTSHHSGTTTTEQRPRQAYLPGWTLTVSGLSSGRVERLGIADMLGRSRTTKQVTRLFCVEGWSAIAWWGGLRFADLLQAYPHCPARAGRSSNPRQPGRRRQSRSVLRVDRPADRSTPANPARYASVRKDAPGRTRRAPAAAGADETRTQEHQGYHLDRLLRRGAGRLLERARLLQVRRAVGHLPDACFATPEGGRGLMDRHEGRAPRRFVGTLRREVLDPSRCPEVAELVSRRLQACESCSREVEERAPHLKLKAITVFVGG